jgi:hypothetical protein
MAFARSLAPPDRVSITIDDYRGALFIPPGHSTAA